MLLGGIEGGHQKFIVAVSNQAFGIIARKEIATDVPSVTMQAIFDFFDQYPELVAIGIGAFGPIDTQPLSYTYGQVLTTPVAGWSGYQFLAGMQKWRDDLAYYWTSNINAAAWAEYLNGSGQRANTMLYLNVGNDVGMSIVHNGKLYAGAGMPQGGHVLVTVRQDDSYEGYCPFHGNRCLEGLVAGPAVKARYGIEAVDLADDHPAWELIADYVSQALISATVLLRPNCIVLGGGILQRPHLVAHIKDQYQLLSNHFLEQGSIIDQYILRGEYQEEADILGALALAKSLV